MAKIVAAVAYLTALISTSAATIYNPNDLELAVDFGLVVYPNTSNNNNDTSNNNDNDTDLTRVGMKAGDWLNATCKLRRKSAADAVSLAMGVAGSEEWTGLKTTMSDAGGGEITVATTDEHVAKKEYHGRPVTCVVRRASSSVDVDPGAASTPTLAAKNSSEQLNVLFEPTASVNLNWTRVENWKPPTDWPSIENWISDFIYGYIHCVAEPGNPPDVYRWSPEIEVEGSDVALTEKQVKQFRMYEHGVDRQQYEIGVVQVRPFDDRYGQTNLIVSCIVTNGVTANGTKAQYKMEITPPLVLGIDVAEFHLDPLPIHYGPFLDLRRYRQDLTIGEGQWGGCSSNRCKTGLASWKLRCRVAPPQASVSLVFYDDDSFAGQRVLESDRSHPYRFSRRDHGKSIRCLAKSGDNVTLSPPVILNFAFPNQVELQFYRDGVLSSKVLIEIRGNPNFNGTYACE